MSLDNHEIEALKAQESALADAYEKLCSRGLNLDITRGKPSSDQLALSDALDGILDGDFTAKNGSDARNYGGIEGLAEARKLGGELLGLPIENVIAGGNSSLTMMYQAMSVAHLFGLDGFDSAWANAEDVSVICPVPGYDRHFGICEHLSLRMITVPMTSEGPDMNAVETIIREDESVRAMWCVPKYSNPTGVTYSDEVVERIAALGKTSHPDFRVFWDNAYAVHDFDENAPVLSNIFEACKRHQTEDSVIQFASTSKITHAGAGVAFMGASEKNLDGFLSSLSWMTIGPDKVNQLRHARFFQAANSLNNHMRKHAAIIKPRFDCVLKQLTSAFSDNDFGTWETPKGGYFISFNTRPGLAKHIVDMAQIAGVKLTPAGATFPHGEDPEDRNIRIAPTVPSVADLEQAMEVFVICVKLASIRSILNDQ